MPTFSAPWDLRLKLVTGFFLVLLAALIAVGLQPTPDGSAAWTTMKVGIPIAIIAGAAAFVVRGYTIRAGVLHIHRLGWDTTIDLAGLTDAEVYPGATAGSIRTFGNGGLFGFIGRFRNSLLGSYRAYLTDAARTVVLRFGEKTIVISPHDPEAFVEAVQTRQAH